MRLAVQMERTRAAADAKQTKRWSRNEAMIKCACVPCKKARKMRALVDQKVDG
jgi:hypothetical protein